MQVESKRHILQALVTSPQGPDAWFAVPFASQEASQFRDSAHKIANRQGRTPVLQKMPQHANFLGRSYLFSRRFRLHLQGAPQLVNAHGYDGQHRQTSLLAFDGLEATILLPAATLLDVVKDFDHP